MNEWYHKVVSCHEYISLLRKVQNYNFFITLATKEILSSMALQLAINAIYFVKIRIILAKIIERKTFRGLLFEVYSVQLDLVTKLYVLSYKHDMRVLKVKNKIENFHLS